MVHFHGTEYRAHTSCISEAQKYQGALYKEKKPKTQHQKNNSASQNNSQALVPRKAYVEDACDAETGAVAIVDAPPRAPSPPPAARSLGYQEKAALPPVDVFEFLDTSETPNPPRVQDESRMIEDSLPPAYEENTPVDVMNFQVPNSEEDPRFRENGFAYGEEPVIPSNERYDSTYNLQEQNGSFTDSAYYTTPAPKTHRRTKSSDKGLESSTKTTDRKRKRNSPAELDMSLVRAQHEKDIMMADAPPLHSGLTGGLSRLLSRPEFPPSPDYSGDYVEASPLSPMKRAKQSTSKALVRAQREWEIQQENERKAEMKAEIEREKERERGRERERKPRKAGASTTKELVKIKPKRRDDSVREGRRTRDAARRRRRQYSSSPSPERGHKTMKAIEYRKDSGSPNPENGALILRASGELAPVREFKGPLEARAELFMSFVTKGPDSERGMSVNKVLKRYHRERYDKWDRDLGKVEEEKELWKSMRLRRNDRGEIVMFFAQPDA
jgi:cell growth-regulating nucleolar protein